MSATERASGDPARDPLVLSGDAISISEVESVARHGRPVRIAPAVRDRLDAMRAQVDQAARGEEAIYGVNTGFGSLSRVRIAPDDVREVQRNLIRSHAAGVGDPLPREVVRAMMLILAASLARGRSGVRTVVVERIVDLLNGGLTPFVPSRGSVGASGDLAPLAHLALVLIGEGALCTGREVSRRDAQPSLFGLHSGSVEPVALQAKEGLALINGTHLMSALGALALTDTERLCHAALTAAAMAIDACRATDEFLDPRVHEARRQPGQIEAAKRIRTLLAGSEIIASHKVDDPRVQDPYSLRAIPQVLGAVLDTITSVRSVFECELGAVTDNPLVFAAEGIEASRHQGSRADSPLDFLSGGNFHGMPLAIAIDSLKIALCHLAGIAERRINWLLTASDSENPVNPYLSPQPGLHSGLMIAQYTAAACCNELQTLAVPASVANIPTSAGMEDYNSMGATSAYQLRRAVDLATNVVAIELLVMAEALEYQRPLRSGGAVETAHETIRTVTPRLTHDRPPSRDIETVVELIKRGMFDRRTNEAHGH